MEYKGMVYAKINGKYIECTETIEDLEKPILKKDIKGNPIREGDKFKFKYMKELDNHIELIGYFEWSDNHLSYVINICENDEYEFLYYIGSGVMYGFELLN